MRCRWVQKGASKKKIVLYYLIVVVQIEVMMRRFERS